MRQLKRRPRSKKEVLTQGGQGDYVIAENELRDFVRMIAHTQKLEDARRLVFALFTNREIADIVRRISIAKLLLSGNSYNQTVAKASTSRATVSLIRRMLKINPEIAKLIVPELKSRFSNQKNIIKRLSKGK